MIEPKANNHYWALYNDQLCVVYCWSKEEFFTVIIAAAQEILRQAAKPKNKRNTKYSPKRRVKKYERR